MPYSQSLVRLVACAALLNLAACGDDPASPSTADIGSESDADAGSSDVPDVGDADTLTFSDADATERDADAADRDADATDRDADAADRDADAADRDADVPPVDTDDDGFPDDEDCEPENEFVFPGADEICDGVDNDCDPETLDGVDDEGLGAECDSDADDDACLDGAMICEAGVLVCEDDPTPLVEICDHIDNDCDGNVDFDAWVPDDYATIAEAAAVGGHVCVAAGTWEAADIAPAAALILEGMGRDETTLDADGNGVFDTDFPLTVSHMTIANAAENDSGIGFIEAAADVTITDLIFIDANISGAEYGELVSVDEANLYATDIEIDAAVVDLEAIWYGFLYVYYGEMHLNGIDIHDVNVTTTESIYGTLYHEAGVVTFEDVVVRDSVFHADSGTYGLIYTEEESEESSTFLRVAALNNVLTTSDYYGALSLDDHYGPVTVDNLLIIGNTITTDSSYGILGYLATDEGNIWRNVVIAGETHNVSDDVARIVYSIGSDSVFENWDIVNNTVTASEPGPLFDLDGDAVLRNISIVNNGVGRAFDGVATGGSLDVAYCNILEDGEGDLFVSAGVAFTPEGLLSVEPGYVNIEGDIADWDLHLAEGSELIDAGDPAILDADESTSDIGAYGGPNGGNW